MKKFIERQRYLLDFTLSSMWRRKGRNLALLFVYALVVFLLASMVFFTNGVRSEAEAVFVDGPDMTVQRLQAGRHALAQADMADRLAEIRGVEAAEGRLWGYYYDPETRANYTLMASGIIGLEDGEVALGHGVARLWGIEAGDSLSLVSASGKPAAFVVVEVFARDTELVSSDLIILAPAAFRRFFDIDPGLVTDIAVTIPNPDEAPNIARKVAERFPGMRPILKSEVLRTYRALFDWRSGIVQILLASALLAFFIFAWDKATGLSQEEKVEIGALKALGWDTSDILLARTWEGAVISALAFVSGVLLAWLHVFPFSAALLTPVLKGWSTLFPVFRPMPAVDFFSLVQLFFLTVVPYSVIGIIPAWRIAITDPSEVLR